MAIAVIGRDGRTGIFTIHDEKPDGTILVFSCEQSGQLLPVDTKIAELPDPAPNLTESQRGDFLLAIGRRLSPLVSPDKVNRLDTTNLDPGVQRFDEEQFGSLALDVSYSAEQAIALSDRNRDMFGYLGEGPFQS